MNWEYTLDVERIIGAEERSAQRVFTFLRDGTNEFRFLPPWSAERIAFLRVYTHSGFKNSGLIFCPRYMAKLPCPICEYADTLIAKGLSEEGEDVRRFKAKPRYIANVVDLHHPDDGVKVLVFPRMVYDDLLLLIKDVQNFGDFTHPEKGYPVQIVRTRHGNLSHMCRYSVRGITTKRGPVNPEWLKGLYDLKAIVVPKTYDELTKVLADMIEGGDDSLLNPSDYAAPSVKTEAVKAGASHGDDWFDPESFMSVLT